MFAEQCPASPLAGQPRSGQIFSTQVFPYSSPSYKGDKEHKPQDTHQYNCIMNLGLSNRILFRRSQQKVRVSSKLVPHCHSDQVYHISSFQRRFFPLFSIIDFIIFCWGKSWENMLGIYIGNNSHVQSVHLFLARKRKKKKKEDLAKPRTKLKKIIKATELKRKPSGTLIKARLNFSPFFEV